MHPDAMETFTPPDMGGDTRLGEAKKRIGSKVCMIGGFDQFHFFNDCTLSRQELKSEDASMKPAVMAGISFQHLTISSRLNPV